MSASVWVSSPASSRSTIGSSAATIVRALGRGQPRAERQQLGADLHQRVGEDHLLAARVHGQGRGRAAADAVGGEAARDPGRLRLELGVGHLGAVRDQGGAVGATLGSLGEPVVELHRPDIVPIMPKRHKDAPPEQDLYAPIEWQSAGEYDDIRYEKADGIAKVTIDRPEVLNAFRPQTLVEVAAALELAREDTEIGAIILTGEGQKAFCSGGDQTVRGDTGYVAEGASLGRFHVTDLQVQMRRLPKPVVAMVAGYAIGGGHILHVCCDLTIAADNAVFGQTGPRVGSWDGGFGASLLRDLVGTKKAKEFWLLCRQYDAEEALEMGLVNTVVPLAELERETVAWCRDMLVLSPFALRLAKASFNAHEDGYAGIQQLAHDANLLFYGNEEAREGREAFKEKRQPDFSKFPRRP